jgi:archaemetzincin
MNAIHLIAVGTAGRGRPAVAEAEPQVSLQLLDELAAALAYTFRVSCHVRKETLEAGFAYDPARNQYYSTAILQRLEALPLEPGNRLLGITALDLYVPVLTFVFGEAQLTGACALVSLHRLRQEFYGLPPSNDLLHERVIKEGVHELGHTFGLRHCENWRCVMASSHAVERLDTKGADFCPACRDIVDNAAYTLPRL